MFFRNSLNLALSNPYCLATISMASGHHASLFIGTTAVAAPAYPAATTLHYSHLFNDPQRGVQKHMLSSQALCDRAMRLARESHEADVASLWDRLFPPT
jgi:hypothetical protein